MGLEPEMTQMIEIDGLVHLLEQVRHGRVLIGIAGAPGSGKSTITRLIEERLNKAEAGTAAILPMDGFHYDDMLLETLGRRGRKGAPDTFDVGGFRHILIRLQANTEDNVAVPVFDRDIEIARAGARLISKTIRVVLVEGNYLLLRQSPWAMLKPLFHLTVMVEASLETLQRRLTARWVDYGLPADEVVRRVEQNDMPNGRFVITESIPADYALENNA